MLKFIRANLVSPRTGNQYEERVRVDAVQLVNQHGGRRAVAPFPWSPVISDRLHMTTPAVPDVITIVGSSYFQPIADLVERLLKRPVSAPGPSGTGHWENGYAAAVTVLLVAVLESFTSRLRFMRTGEFEAGGMSVPDILRRYFSDLPNYDELVEVFLLRNIVVHNHVWHLNVSEFPETSTIATPQDLGFKTNQHYEPVVNVATKRTRQLALHATPTSVDRTDVAKVFDRVWGALWFMHSRSFQHTPLAGRTVGFRGERIQFEELAKVLHAEGGESAA